MSLPANSQIHAIKPGDTLSAIARHYWNPSRRLVALEWIDDAFDPAAWRVRFASMSHHY